MEVAAAFGEEGASFSWSLFLNLGDGGLGMMSVFFGEKKKAASVVCHEVTILAVVTVSSCGFYVKCMISHQGLGVSY